MAARRYGTSALALAVWLVLTASPVAALDPDKQLSQFWHRSWTQQHGLPQDSVRAMAQASDGALWLGTDEGLARFDGAEFTIFGQGTEGLPNSQITALMAGRDGAIWIGTLAGVSRYHNAQFQHYDRTDGLGTQAVTDLVHASDGTVWAVGGVLVSAIRAGRIVNFGEADGVPPEGLREMVETADGVLLGVGFGGVVRFDGSRFVRLSTTAELGDDIAVSLSVDGAGVVWAGTTRGIVAVEPGGRIRRYGLDDGIPAVPVRALLHDRDGTLWAGTTGGLARLVGDRFEPVNAPGLRPRVWVSDLLEDRDGSLWIGTRSGLHRFREQAFAIYGTPEGFPSDQPAAVFEDRDGVLWVGYQDAGVLRLAPDAPTRYTSGHGLASNEVFCIRGARNGDVLVGTREGLSRIRADGSVTMLTPLDPFGRRAVYDVIEDAQHRLWLATVTGVIVVEGGRQTWVLGGGPTLSDAVVSLAFDDDGALWAGTYDKGLWRYKDGHAEHFTQRHGLSGDAVRALLHDGDMLWIGMAGGGLGWFRDGRFIAATRRQGLDSDYIGQIIDGGADLWLGTPTGLLRVRKHALLDGDVRLADDMMFAASAGLRSSQCAPGYPVVSGGARDRQGRIWAVTASGLAMLDPRQLTTSRPPPAPSITAAIVDGSPVDPGAPFEVPAGAQRVEFQFAVVWLSTPERLGYQYRLEGVDATWVNARGRRSADYNNLPPGRYRFVVKAALGDGVEGPPASVEFRRRAAWFEAAWFPFAVVGGLVLCASGLYWLRLRQVRARFALLFDERARISRELHDTLAQDFVGIATQLSGVASALRRAPDVAEHRLALARRMTQHSLTEARRSIMDLRASALQERDLPEALDHVTREMAAGSGVQLVMSTDEAAAPTDEHRQQQLLRIAQEAVTNALKHARPSRIDLSLAHQNGHTVLTVKDDGAGFSPDGVFTLARGHFGLLGMRERARAIGGELTVQSAPGAGTVVEARVPRP